MKLTLTLAVILIAAIFTPAQITSVSQLEDVKATDVFYADLKSLIENYGVINNDLIVVADDTFPKPANVSIGNLYYPKTRLTNRQLAFILETTIDNLKTILGRVAVPDHLDELGKYRFVRQIQGLINKQPLNKLVIASHKDVKGLSPRFEEYASLTELIDDHGIGRDLIERNLTYNRTKTYSEKAISDILGNALGVKPDCKGKVPVCKIGNLTLDYRNRLVNRGRFAMILNQYVEAFFDKANRAVASYEKK